MVETQTEWPLLSHFDASTIKSDPQLATMMKKGCSLSQTRCGQRDSAIDERQGPLTRGSRQPSSPETPQFFNAMGVSTIEIGVAAFDCIGELPPHDHPHVYLNMGQEPAILCPYCATQYRVNIALRWNETIPVNCWAGHP
jgi:uncharacterized Zn-finger protein